MPAVSGCEVFGIDWTDLEAVKRLADKLGEGCAVVKYQDRPNYNIMPKRSMYLLPTDAMVIYHAR